MIPIPSVLVGPLIGVAIVAGGFGWLRFVHDPGIRAEYAAEIAAATAAERARNQDAALAAVSDAEAEARSRDAARVVIRERIIRVPVTAACAASPAVGTAVDGLRSRPAGAGAAIGAGGAAGVPGAAGAAREPVR